MSFLEKNNFAAFSSDARLVADIGAAHARFALETSQGKFESICSLNCNDYSGIEPLLRAYLANHSATTVRHAAFAIANPVDGDFLRMTNRDWTFSIEDIRQKFGLQTLLITNDFAALAMSLPALQKKDLVQIAGGAPVPKSVIGLLGPGTGLGVSALIPTSDGFITLNSEGGHVNFAPSDEREFAIFQHAKLEWQHVSAERIISRPGMEMIYRALAKRNQSNAPPLSSKAIMSGALSDHNALCIETLDCFCGLLGSFSGDLALSLSAVGGIYIAGGIVPQMLEWFAKSTFRARFEAKGRFSAYLAQIPTYVITTDNAAFYGMSAILSEHLRGKNGDNSLADRIGQLLAELSPEVLRVANLALENPRAIVDEPIEEIARLASASESAVILFCRSLGFLDLADFKLECANSLTGSISVRYLRKAQLELEELVEKRTEELRQSKLQLEEIAFLDALTGLPNRRLFSQRFENFIAFAKRNHVQFALLLIDLDKFKYINDSYGHDAGDAVLIAVKEKLKLATRAVDVVARLGGDEFAILLDGPGSVDSIQLVGERIIKMCADPILFGDLQFTITVSIGAAIFDFHGTTQTALYKAADLALYEAKGNGRNTWRCSK